MRVLADSPTLDRWLAQVTTTVLDITQIRTPSVPHLCCNQGTRDLCQTTMHALVCDSTRDRRLVKISIRSFVVDLTQIATQLVPQLRDNFGAHSL